MADPPLFLITFNVGYSCRHANASNGGPSAGAAQGSRTSQRYAPGAERCDYFGAARGSGCCASICNGGTAAANLTRCSLWALRAGDRAISPRWIRGAAACFRRRRCSAAPGQSARNVRRARVRRAWMSSGSCEHVAKSQHLLLRAVTHARDLGLRGVAGGPQFFPVGVSHVREGAARWLGCAMAPRFPGARTPHYFVLPENPLALCLGCGPYSF